MICVVIFVAAVTNWFPSSLFSSAAVTPPAHSARAHSHASAGKSSGATFMRMLHDSAPPPQQQGPSGLGPECVPSGFTFGAATASYQVRLTQTLDNEDAR